MNKYRLVSLSVLVVFLYGCASGAKFTNMTYTHSTGMKFDRALKNQVELSAVQGGEKTNPLWTSEISNEAFREAVAMSLASHGLLAKSGRYHLKVNLT